MHWNYNLHRSFAIIILEDMMTAAYPYQRKAEMPQHRLDIMHRCSAGVTPQLVPEFFTFCHLLPPPGGSRSPASQGMP